MDVAPKGLRIPAKSATLSDRSRPGILVIPATLWAFSAIGGFIWSGDRLDVKFLAFGGAIAQAGAGQQQPVRVMHQADKGREENTLRGPTA